MLFKWTIKKKAKLFGKGIIEVFYKSMGRQYPSKIQYLISFYSKDGRCKYEITDFVHETEGACEAMINTKRKVMGVSLQRNYNFYLTQLDEFSQNLSASLKAWMLKPSKNKDDW